MKESTEKQRREKYEKYADMIDKSKDQSVQTTPVDKYSLNIDQIDSIKDIIERTHDMLQQETLDADMIIAHLGIIAKMHNAAIKPVQQVTIREDGVKLIGPTITIKCESCGKDHLIKIQDQSQVKRCPACQKVHRNAQRAAKRKENNARKKEEKEIETAQLSSYCDHIMA